MGSYSLGRLLSGAIEILIIIIIAEVIVTNMIAFHVRISPYHPFVKLLRKVTNPILDPVRRVLPSMYKTGGWDFSPMVVILILWLLQGLLVGH